jgi:glucose-6-phosphate dehydrogenase assembly protein OpcA
MTTTDLLQGEESLDLDSATVERALAELWQRAAAGSEGTPVARARVMTLVVYTEDEESARLAERVAGALPERHPSRGIVVNVLPNEQRPLSADVSIQCLISPSGGRKICSEQVTVTAGADSRYLIAGAVTPLLVADLPAVFWWTGRPRPADPVLRRFARGAVDRIVVDSGLFRDPGAGLIALARWREDPSRRAAIGDLAWERLREWRLLLAQTVNPPEALARLPSIVEVVIEYAAGVLPPEALLLTGWLAAALRWQAMDSPAHGVVTFSTGRQTVSVRLVAQERPGAVDSIHSVRLTTTDGADYSVSVVGQPGIGLCLVRDNGKDTLERMVPLVHGDAVDLVVRAVGRRGRDPVYEAALAAAADFIVLGVTA